MSGSARYLHRRRAPAARPPRLRVGFACNDGDNGLFAGTAEALCVSRGDEMLSLDLTWCRTPRLSVGTNWIRFLQLRFPIFGSKDWVGNWCWNEYVLELPDVARLLDRAVSSGKYGCDCAEGDAACDLMDLLDADAPLHMIEDALHRFGKAEGR